MASLQRTGGPIVHMPKEVLVQATLGVRTVTVRISHQALGDIAGPPMAQGDFSQAIDDNWPSIAAAAEAKLSEGHWTPRAAWSSPARI
jgi:hypothetical protein